MKKKWRWIKKITALAAAAILCLGCLSGSALGAEAKGKVQPVDTKADINIYVYNNNEASSVGDGSENPSVGGSALEGVELKYVRLGDLVQYSSGTETEMLYRIQSDFPYCKILGINDSNVKYQDNVNGYYYLVPDELHELLNVKVSDENVVQFISELETEMGAAAGSITTVKTDGSVPAAKLQDVNGLYLFIGGSMPENVATLITPFLVSAPMPDTEGNGWNSNIHVYPKVRTSEITLTKSAEQDGRITGDSNGNRIFAESGKAITYTITAALPGYEGAGTQRTYEKFVFSDTLPTGITLNGTAGISMTDNNVSVDLVQNTDYTYEYKDNVITFSFTELGRKKLSENPSQNKVITITYTAEIGEGAAIGTAGNANTVTLSYQRDGMTAEADKTASASVHTYGIDLTKELSDGSSIQVGDNNKITFTLKKDTDGGEQTVHFTGGTNGVYWADGDGSSGDITEMSVAANGKLKINGLVPGTYILEETQTMDGYTLLDQPITIIIKDPSGTLSENGITGTVDGQTAQITFDGGAVQLTVVNTAQSTGFALPQTGGAGTIAAIALGFGLICIAVILLTVYRRKNAK